MSGIFAYLQALLSTIGTAIRWVGAQLLVVFEALWRSFLIVLDQLLSWVIQLVDWIVLGVVDVGLFVIVAAVGILPSMPVAPAAVGSLQDALAVANRYLPVTEALNMGLLWATVYAGVWAYKGGKFLRGGG